MKMIKWLKSMSVKTGMFFFCVGDRVLLFSYPHSGILWQIGADCAVSLPEEKMVHAETAEKRRKTMTKRKIILISAVLAVLVAGAVIGVSLYRNRFDAGEYVQAVLDVSYKNETEQYVEITGVGEEEAEKIFDDNLDATMEGFKTSDMPEELLPKYQELFGELAQKVCYTVEKPKRGEDGVYEVVVKVKPITLFPDTYQTFQEKAQEYADQVTNSVMAGEEMPSDEEMQSQIYQIYYDVLREKVDSGMLYGEVKDVVLHVAKESGNEFTIAKEDMDKLDSVLIEDVQGEIETQE